MKTTILVLLMALVSIKAICQSEFKGQSFATSKKNDDQLKKNFTAYTTYELNIAEIKAHIRQNRSGKVNKSKPVEFYIWLDNEKLKFSVFENNIFDDNYFYLENGQKKYENKKDLNTFAGFVGDDSKNVLRIFISDKRLSGNFTYKDVDYVIGHLADYGIIEKGNPNKSEIIIAKAADEKSFLSGMKCGTLTKTTKVNGRVAACDSFTCKYFKLAISTDWEFVSLITQLKNAPINITSVTNPRDVLIDMVNRLDLIYFRDLGLRIKLIATDTPTSSNDPYISISTEGNTIMQEFQQKSPINIGNTQYDIHHFITGRRMGVYSNPPQWQYGQSTQRAFGTSDGSATSISASSKYPDYYDVGDPRRNEIVPLSYTDCYLIMGHEMGHVMGASHPTNCSPKTVMCEGEGKNANFATVSKDEINCYLAGKISFLNTRNVTNNNGYSNFMTLQLNGVNTTTPMYINGGQKVLTIKDAYPFVLLPVTTFTANDSRPYFFYKTNTAAKFQINSAPNFTMSVSAADQCNTYYSNVFFVYSPSGLRLATNAYPNPTEGGDLIVEDVVVEGDANNEDVSIESIEIYSKEGELLKNISVMPHLRKVMIDTKQIKAGHYLVKVKRTDGTTETKQINIIH